MRNTNALRVTQHQRQACCTHWSCQSTLPGLLRALEQLPGFLRNTDLQLTCATGSAWQAGDAADLEAELSGWHGKGIALFSHERKHGRQAPSGARMSHVPPCSDLEGRCFPHNLSKGHVRMQRSLPSKTPLVVEESPGSVEQPGRSCQQGRAVTELAQGSALLAPGLEARLCGNEAVLLHPQGLCGCDLIPWWLGPAPPGIRRVLTATSSCPFTQAKG